MDIFEKYPKSAFLRGLPEDSDFFPLRQRIGDLFKYLDGLEDSYFEHGLDQDPHARLWEMILAKVLKSEGYAPSSTDHGPDFVVKKDARRIFVEAICPGSGDEDNPNSVPPIVHGGSIAEDIPVDQIVLRVCAALDEKKWKFLQYLKDGVISAGDICIIAINTSKIGRASGLWPSAIMRATHGLGDPYVVFGYGEGVIARGIATKESIQKNNGTAISTSFFFSGEARVISAVLYSTCSFFSFPFDPYKEVMVVHNPNANSPLSLRFIRRVEDVWTIICHDNLLWRAYRIESQTDLG